MGSQLLLDSIISNVELSESFKKIMADGKVSEAELLELSGSINELMGKIEQCLKPDELELVSKLMTEVSVFHVVSILNEVKR